MHPSQGNAGQLATIDQIEASTVPQEEPPVYLANGALSNFPNTNIVDQSGLHTGVFSSHANSVAQRIAGVPFSQLPDLTQIDAYEANHWLNAVLRRASVQKPLLDTGEVANHSWRGDATDTETNLDILERLDWLVVEDDYFQAVGIGSVANSVIFSHAMNGLTVNRTSSGASSATGALDAIYTAARPAVQLVVPEASSSNATGVVASSAMLLKLLLSPSELKPALLKAVLMAGAVRVTDNSQNGDIENYGASPTTNGLDYRYGAGQLNVLNSYQILSADAYLAGAPINHHGYHEVEDFGERGEINTYTFYTGQTGAEISVSLVWNLNLNLLPGAFNPSPVLYDLNLALYDLTDSEPVLVQSSQSTIDNTENIWSALLPNRHYELRVSHLHPNVFSWPYALAWHISPTPPSANYQIPLLPVSALVLLAGLLCWIRIRRCE